MGERKAERLSEKEVYVGKGEDVALLAPTSTLKHGLFQENVS